MGLVPSSYLAIIQAIAQHYLTKPLPCHTFTMSDNPNPGNFANRPHEEVENIARKGGQSSHQSGFASMDPNKQHDIASKGGQASGGSFEPGDPRAREAGQKEVNHLGSLMSRVITLSYYSIIR